MSYHGRKAESIENEHLRVTVLREGGHIAEILHKRSGVNPLWAPPWPSIEPSAYRASAHSEYGSGVDARLLSGIMGHNLCLDIFGAPSAEEAAAGAGVHGEASVGIYDIERGDNRLVMTASFAVAQIRFERRITLSGRKIEIQESVESLADFDRPIAWTQHVTLGPPFLECGVTRFEVSATQSKVFEGVFGSADYLAPGAEFTWPMAPRNDHGWADLTEFTSAAASSAFSAHLMDPARADASFRASNAKFDFEFGYSWNRADFPWLGRWEENRSRPQAPWNGVTVACGMEFGVSPMPETRREMVDRGVLFGQQTYRWLPAHGRIDIKYYAGFTERGTL